MFAICTNTNISVVVFLFKKCWRYFGTGSDINSQNTKIEVKIHTYMLNHNFT